jgi:hypothetical protein
VALLLGHLNAPELPYSPSVIQCDHRSAVSVVEMLAMPGISVPTVLAMERFVVGNRASRSSTSAAGATTRNLLGELLAWADTFPRVQVRSVQRPAGAVKPWATDERLAAAGLLDITKGMNHARDAARHALFAAVADFGQPDPLSRRAAR